MNEIVALYPKRELHFIRDNLNTHKTKHDHWSGMLPQRPIFTSRLPNARSLDQIEAVSVLGLPILAVRPFTSSASGAKPSITLSRDTTKTRSPFIGPKHSSIRSIPNVLTLIYVAKD